jgi:hypothetical protein
MTVASNQQGETYTRSRSTQWLCVTSIPAVGSGKGCEGEHDPEDQFSPAPPPYAEDGGPLDVSDTDGILGDALAGGETMTG